MERLTQCNVGSEKRATNHPSTKYVLWACLKSVLVGYRILGYPRFTFFNSNCCVVYIFDDLRKPEIYLLQLQLLCCQHLHFCWLVIFVFACRIRDKGQQEELSFGTSERFNEPDLAGLWNELANWCAGGDAPNSSSCFGSSSVLQSTSSHTATSNPEQQQKLQRSRSYS